MILKLRNFITPFIKHVKGPIPCSKVYSTSAAVKIDTEKTIKVEHWNINYLKVGNGPHNVLLIPGALGTIWTDFKPQIECFDREKFTLIVWEPPGYGKSRPPDRDFPANMYDRDAHSAHEFMKAPYHWTDLNEIWYIDISSPWGGLYTPKVSLKFIKAVDVGISYKALQIPRYSVLGWSDGGSVAMLHAARYPAAVHRLVVWATNSYILPEELALYRKTRDLKSWSEKMKKPMVDFYGEEVFASYWVRWLEGMHTVYEGNKGEICSNLLKDIVAPTFILYGEKDPIVAREHITHLNSNIKGSRIHLYPEGKHNIHLRYPEDFNKRVQKFLLES